MIGAMQAIEFAEYGCSCRAGLRLVRAGNLDFNAGAENVGLLLV